MDAGYQARTATKTRNMKFAARRRFAFGPGGECSPRSPPHGRPVSRTSISCTAPPLRPAVHGAAHTRIIRSLLDARISKRPESLQNRRTRACPVNHHILYRAAALPRSALGRILGAFRDARPGLACSRPRPEDLTGVCKQRERGNGAVRVRFRRLGSSQRAVSGSTVRSVFGTRAGRMHICDP